MHPTNRNLHIRIPNNKNFRVNSQICSKEKYTQTWHFLRLPCCWCSVLCDHVKYSMPGSSVLHYFSGLLKFMSIEPVMLSNHLILCRLLLLLPSIFPSIFPMTWLFVSGGQNIGASASASILPLTIQDWFHLGLTSLISLQSKWLSSLFQHHSINSLVLRFLYSPTLTSTHDYLKNHSFD